MFEDFKIVEICSFTIPMKKNIIRPYFKKKSIIFGQLSAFQSASTEKPLLIVYGEIKQDLKNLKKTTQNR